MDRSTKRIPLDFLVVTSYYPPPYQAASNRALSLARHLTRRLPGVRLGFLVLDDGGVEAGQEDGGWLVERRNWLFRPTQLNPLHLMWAVLSCVLSVSRHCPSLVMVTTPPANALLGGILGARITSVPVVVDLQDDWEGVYRDTLPDGALLRRLSRILLWAYSLAAGWLYRQVDLMVTADEALARMVKERYPGPAIPVMNGTDPSDLSGIGERRPGDAGFTIIFSGNLSWRPGLVPQVACHLRTPGDLPLTLELIGPGSDATMAELRASLAGVKGSHLGVLPRDEALRRIARADVALLAMAEHSQVDHVFPVKLMDYLVCGTPVLAVVPRGSKAASVVEASRGGIVVPPSEIEDVPVALRQLLSTPFCKASSRNRSLQPRILDAARQWDRLLKRLGRMGLRPGSEGCEGVCGLGSGGAP